MLVGIKSVTTIGGFPSEAGVVKLNVCELAVPVELVATIFTKYRVMPFRNEIGRETETGVNPETSDGIATPVFVALTKFGSVP